MDIKELVEALNVANTELKNMKEKHEAEIKSNGEALTETKSALEASQERFTELQEKFTKFDQEFKDYAAKQELVKQSGGQRKSMGQLFVESEVFAKNAGDSMINKTVSIERKDITGGAASAGALQDSTRDPEVYRAIGGYRATRMRDLIPSLPISSGSVEIMRQNAFTNNAAPQTAELAAKAQSAMTWELVTLSAKTIAHYEIASRQSLSDAAMLQGLVDQELNYGLQLEMDDQILNGDGTGQNFTGVLTDAAVNDVGDLTGGAAADKAKLAINLIREAITACQQNEYYNINGIVISPATSELLETAVGADGNYLLIPFNNRGDGTQTIWRVPVVVTNAIADDTFILGDWQMAAKLYQRETVSVRVSESHANLFVENGVAILAEERAVLGINRPKALAKGSFAGTV